MPTALVTGPVERISEMVLALKRAGFEVVAAESDADRLPPRLPKVDCYVQLPVDAPDAENALGWARSVVTHTLTARFDAAAQVAPMLATNARVVLVADAPDERPPPDMRLVRVLAEAVIADQGAINVRVATIDGTLSPDEIAAAIRLKPRSWTGYSRIEPHLTFADWRHHIMSVSTPPDTGT